jgi:glycosyltransferase involved in cell wall biosynthesis
MHVPVNTPGRERPMDKPKVSVIMPVYNGERFLEDAIHSVLGQAYRPIELIVVDDGSTDGTAEIARRFEEMRYLHQENAGPSVARNTAMGVAEGSMLAFLDSDDRWTPDKLTCQVGHMTQHPEHLFTIAKFRYFLEPNCPIPSSFKPELLERELVGRIPSTLVARREAFEKVGEFDPSLRTGEDVDWFARAKDLDVPMAVIPKVLLHKRVHDRNASSDAAANTPLLMKVLQQSIRRQKARQEQARRGEEEHHG